MMQHSFRDPSGFVYLKDGKVFRSIEKSLSPIYKKLFQEEWYETLVSEKKIQPSFWVENEELHPDYSWVEHDIFDFPLFAHQTSAEQLFHSAKTTLEIAQKAFAHGWVLKDASAWNVVSLYGYSQFCDVTSFEPYDGSSLWMAYGQFCRHYIIPLLLFKNLGMSPANLFTLNRDGIDPKIARKLLGFYSGTSIAAVETVLLPSIFDRRSISPAENSIQRLNTGLNKAIFQSVLIRLGKYLEHLRPSKGHAQSTWSDYECNRQHYSKLDLVKKYDFIKNSLARVSGSALDLGCNQGEYSLLAASLGLRVVASDFDDYALCKLQAKLRGELINVMFLNLAQPTPAIGWKNIEHESFINKSKNYFGIVLCLGLIHHLLVSERIPLHEILDLLGTMSQRYVLIEWVNPCDLKFAQISSINAHLYVHMDESYFEEAVVNNFHILDSLSLDQAKRKLYLLEKRSI